MNNRIKNTFLLIVCLSIAICSSAIAQQYAIAVGSSSLYQMKLDGSTITSTPIYSLGSTVTNRSAAVCNDKLIITETDGTTSSLRVFSLTGGTIAEESSISLKNVKYARSIAVDSSGGIYVGDGSTSTAYYAYVPSLSSMATSKMIGSTHAPLRDVAASDSTALIISEYGGGDINNMSYVSSLRGGDIRYTVSLSRDSNYVRIPVAVAAVGSYGYVISQDMVKDSASTGNGVLSTCTINPSDGVLTAGASYELSGFDPTDITTYTNGTTDYLAMIGRDSDNSLLVKIADTASIISGSISWRDISLSSDGSVDYKFIGSDDGTTLWYSRPSGTVGAIDTTTYSFIGQGANLGGITGLVAFTSGMDPVTVVPEPSSLASLAAFGLGAIGIFRRKKAA